MPAQIPILTTRQAQLATWRSVLADAGLNADACPQLSDADTAVDHLAVELPRLCLLDADDPQLPAQAIMQSMVDDSWLLQTGVIVVYQNWDSARVLQDMTACNLILSIEERNLARDLPHAIEVVDTHEQLLFQRGMGQQLMDNLSAQFDLDNDPQIARCVVNLVCNCLYQAGRLDLAERGQLQLALVELMLNAIEHGNCEISSQDKTRWLESGQRIEDLVEQRNADPQIRQRRVHFEYQLLADRAEFLIRDQGRGFDWRTALNPDDDPERLLSLHGRGLQMAQMAADQLHYNEAGNQVHFSIRHQHARQATPQLFAQLEGQNFDAGELVFEQGASGDALYFIARGRFAVEVNGRQVAVLDHSDILLGEMSFLLSGRRDASVRALEPGRLIPITRRQFMQSLREHPHYGLFLSRLLARRLSELNRQIHN